MEKRLFLAVVLMTAVILLTNKIFPPPERPEEGTAPATADSIVAPATVTAGSPGPVLPVATPQTFSGAPADTVSVESPLFRYSFSTLGASLVSAELLNYPSYTEEGRSVQLVPAASRFLAQRLVVGGDTVDLRSLPFTVQGGTGQTLQAPADLVFTYGDSTGFGVSIRYSFSPEQYLIGIAGRVDGLQGREARLLTEIGPGLEPHEAAEHHSERELAAVASSEAEGVRRSPLRKVGEPELLPDTVTWAGIKDKYFLAAVIAAEGNPLLGGSITRVSDATVLLPDSVPVVIPQARVTAALPLKPDGTFAYSAWVGPQDYELLSAVGNDLEEVTPYGYRWLQPVIRPLAAAVLWVLNTLHGSLGLAYGWVLVIFGVMMRIVLWPLNAKAMRAQMKNMAVQPLIQEVRDKYSKDPQKQQEAMLALYKEHGFNPFGGCLPLLIPFPVLITLYFVFQNTIAFRGADFLWLPDLSLKDPYYILPIIGVGSMFALQLVSTRMSGIEQNAQMKMMMYMMPLMMGFIFFMFPAGLNLYYSVTQIASVPQQLMIAKERSRASAALKKDGSPKATPPPPAAGRARAPKGKR